MRFDPTRRIQAIGSNAWSSTSRQTPLFLAGTSEMSNLLPGLSFGLGETLDMLRDSVQVFAAEQIAPRAAEIDRDNQFPPDLWKKLGALGLHGMTVAEEY